MHSNLKRRIFLLAAILLSTIVATTPTRAADSPPADAILGKWDDADNKGTFEIYKKGDIYEGKIASLRETVYPAGNPEAGITKHDRQNPDKALQSRPIVGMVFLLGFTYEDGNYTGGTIYDPESGKTYKCKMTLDGDTLNVRGYIGTPLLGRTEIWHRAKAK